MQGAAIDTLGHYNNPRIPASLIDRWQVLTPPLRKRAVAALLGRTDFAAAVMAALENGRIGATELSSAQINFLRTHRDPAVSQRAVRLFGPVPLQME